MTTINRVSLKPTNQPEMEFDGELLFSETGSDTDGSTGGRCHDISVFRDNTGEMIVAVAYRTSCPGETNRLSAEKAETVDDADAVLSLYDAGTEIDQRILNAMTESDRMRLTGRVLQRYDLQVASVLSQLESILTAHAKS